MDCFEEVKNVFGPGGGLDVGNLRILAPPPRWVRSLSTREGAGRGLKEGFWEVNVLVGVHRTIGEARRADTARLSPRERNVEAMVERSKGMYLALLMGIDFELVASATTLILIRSKH
jgi:hypothetical protein